MEVKGKCSHCNHDIVLDIDVDRGAQSRRWYLRKETECSHCHMVMIAALQDDYNRFWGRKKLFND